MRSPPGIDPLGSGCQEALRIGAVCVVLALLVVILLGWFWVRG